MIRTLSNLGALGFSIVVTFAAPAPGPNYSHFERRSSQAHSLVL